MSNTFLKVGSRGADVLAIQRKLLGLGYFTVGIDDGVFGTKTLRAVKQFQTDHCLVCDGVVGPKTWLALDATTPSPAPDPTPVPPDLRTTIIEKVIANAVALLGTSYSQDYRNNIWTGGTMDCSSYVAAIWAAAGFPLLTVAGDELRTSYREVDAVCFDLIWPSSRSMIGKLPSPKGLLGNYGAQVGDIVFWCFDSSTSRPGKITHVGNIDAGGKGIIHISNNTDKCCRKPFSYGDGRICAIIRLRNDFTLPSLPDVAQAAEDTIRADEWVVRALQIALNIKRGEHLVCDGIMGTKTVTAVRSLNASIGVESNVCNAATWAALGFPNAK